MKIISRWCWLPARLRRNDKGMKKNKVTGLVGTIVLHVVLLLSLRKQDLDSIRRYHGGGNHKEYQQQEYDIRHGCHTKVGRYLLSSFQCHTQLLLLFRFVQQIHKCHSTSFHLADHLINTGHQIIISKHGSNTYHQTSYSSNHRFVNTS